MRFGSDMTSRAGKSVSTEANAHGIRFHPASSQETRDAIQAFGGQRVLQAATTTVLGWDYKAKRTVAASVPTNHAFGGANAPRLEAYDHAGAYAFATSTQASRAATLLREAIEARNKTWLGRGTVRTFTTGTTFELTDSPLDALDGFSTQVPSSQSGDKAPPRGWPASGLRTGPWRRVGRCAALTPR